MTPVWKVLSLGAAAALVAAALGVGGFHLAARDHLSREGPISLAAMSDLSRIVVDREGRLLRPFPNQHGIWRLPVTLDAVDPRFIAQLIAYEDQRFYQHAGVDWKALVRAGGQWLRTGRIVSGGSTLTMQVARLLEPGEQRGLSTKLRQIWRAQELEQRFSKDEILNLYLTLAPYGGNIEGVRAASLAYFGKEPRRLTPSESALLVAIPQSPETRRPDRQPAQARAARERVLARLDGLLRLKPEDHAAAKLEDVPQSRRGFPMLAAHVAEREIAADALSPVVRLSIDARLQSALEPLARDRATAIGPRLSAAVIVVENATGLVRAHVGSTGLFDRQRAGGVDMALGLRSPGSALKPFVYGLAFEDGIAHPETLIEDRPVRFGSYAPENFDQGHMGTLPVRAALQASLNVPVVDLLEIVRPTRFLARLEEGGGHPVTPRGQAPGLAVGLGGLGIRLVDLATLYLGIARGGETIDLAWHAEPGRRERHRVLEGTAAFYIADILKGAAPPDGAPSGRVAWKTGTSYGYRDAWAVGFDQRHTIAVWVGRPDGAPVPGLVGRVAAGPLMFDAFQRVGLSPLDLKPPNGALMVSNSGLPPTLRAFGAARRGLGPLDAPEGRLRVAFPPAGARIDLGGDPTVALKALGGVPPFLWFVDGVPIGEADLRRTRQWDSARRGFAEISVMDATGANDGVRVRLD